MEMPRGEQPSTQSPPPPPLMSLPSLMAPLQNDILFPPTIAGTTNPSITKSRSIAQKLLDEILEKSLVMVKDHPIHEAVGDSTASNEGVIRLFKHSAPGIVVDPIDEPQQPRKRPKILPGKEIDEKSKKFKRRLQSVAVDGKDIMASARNACQKSLARLQAKDAAAKETAKREEERFIKEDGECASNGVGWLGNLCLDDLGSSGEAILDHFQPRELGFNVHDHLTNALLHLTS
ncbi:hypothetical protein PanWU01x14_108050 [Parasponia andersonii]|uniref:Uncharacterized protein n=1 Tax=Parasponia andersonii TaxID=3476 RepID=A0A2P5D0E4_PARAD|nr:hypothetical protein PanWU01x14_108050 [Parasponia andersonii]